MRQGRNAVEACFVRELVRAAAGLGCLSAGHLEYIIRSIEEHRILAVTAAMSR